MTDSNAFFQSSENGNGRSTTLSYSPPSPVLGGGAGGGGLTYAHSAFAGVIGVAREDITPPVGIYARNWGAAAHDAAEGIHRPLYATVLTLQTGKDEPPLVLLTLDLGWWRSYKDEWALRGALLDALSLDPARLMIPLSHTHAGPSICREDADKPGGEFLAPYMEGVAECCLRAIRRALHDAQPATLAWTYGRCNLAVNRDQTDPEHPRRICGFQPDAPADDTLLVGRVTTSTGMTLATLVNYACHPTTLAWENRLLSPDYVGAMRELVEAHTEDAPCLFLMGACGELAPRDEYTADTVVADRNGRQLGFAMLATLEGMLPPQTAIQYTGVVESGAPLAVWKQVPIAPSTTLEAVKLEVELPLKPMPTLAEFDAQIGAETDRALAERLHRKRRIREGVGDGTTTTMPAWLWRVGDAVLLGHPNEAYSALQTELRRAFPQQALAVMNVVNGHFGYLPPAPLFDEDIYAVWQSPFDRGCLEHLISVCLTAIKARQSQGTAGEEAGGEGK